MRKRRLLFLLATTLLLTAACSKSKPNVLIVTFDTTRADHLGYAGGSEGVTPNLDALAADGTWFSTCVSSQPLTLPSHTTIMTGLHPYSHGVRNNGGYVLRDDVTTLAERLKGEGYSTHAIVSSFVLDSQFGLDQGFDGYDDDLRGGPTPPLFMFKEIIGGRVVDKALEWLGLREKAEDPFFLWLHFYDPHANYDPPEDVATKFAGDPYSAEIHYADRELGRVIAKLESLDLMDETLIVFTGDHGESLGEHGEQSHGVFIYDATTRVPLFVKGPGVPSGKRVDSLVRSADVTPTVLELLGLPEAEGLDGSSAVGLMKGKAEESRVAYSESMAPLINFGWSDLRAYRSESTRVIEAPRREIFDLGKDPGELRNVFDVPGAQPADSRRLLVSVQGTRERDPFTSGGQQADQIDPETKKKLAALGYVFGTVRDVEGPRADPKDRISQWESFQVAQKMIREKRYDEAVGLIRGLLEVDTENVTAMGSLANALVASRHREEALEVFRTMIELDPGRENGYLGSARILMNLGRYEEAIELAKAVIEMNPENPEGYTALGDIYLETEQYGEAEPLFRRAFSIDPNSTLAVSGLGNCLNRMGRHQESLTVLRAGHEKEPESQAIVYNLAVVADRLGDSKSAGAYYQKSLEIDSDHSMTWNNLGSLLDRAGKRDEALRCIAKARELDPDNVEATYNLGVLLLAGGRAEEALALLNEALKQRPTLIQAAVQRANALEALGRIDQAVDAFRRLAQVIPAAWLQVARLEAERGHRSAAEDAIAQGMSVGGKRFANAARQIDAIKDLVPAS